MATTQTRGPLGTRRARMLALTTGALLAASLLDAGASSAAAPTGAARFTRVDSATVSGWKPQALDKAPATFMLELAGKPVTVANAATGNKMNKAQKDQLKAQLKTSQGAIIAAAKKAGATVLGSYQLTYNGVKVHATAAQAIKLASLAGVVAIHRITPVVPDNIHGVPLVGAPQVWDGVAGLHGEGIKVAVIDTGIDYTHADFGGPGTPAAYTDALAHDTDPANPAWFGPGAPKVKGGVDLVGDDYNADPTSSAYQPVPHPDPNPLDCYGHGTHTSGTAAGFGVLADGSTYTGSYDANTVSSHSWNVGPGVAPKADLYSIRIFGCAGSTDVTVDAIEWAVAHDMDVINMSLGAPYGGAGDPDSVASDNASLAGVIVVASAGNSGPNPYLTGSPSTSSRAISVAANDPTQSFPAVNVALSTGPTIQAIDANGIPVNGLSAPIKVLYTGTPHDVAHISLGCNPAEYLAANVVGDIVVVKRGTCARVARAIFGEQAGAAAVLMINNANSLPPYEGPITSNPDDGTPFTVTIPFLGVKSSDAAAFVAADTTTATLTDTTLANPGYLATASFSSGGPRMQDSWLKPDVTAPGVSIASAGMGTGIAPAFMSGTSMAAPHTAGVAALVRQAHPSWSVEAIKSAIVNTSDPSLDAGYSTRLNGAGFIQAPPAVATNVVATGDAGSATLNFGFAEYISNYAKSRQVHLTNHGSSAVTFDVTTTRNSGSPHSVGLSASSITVAANQTVNLSVTLSVPVATTGGSSAFHDVAGLVRFTPRAGANHGVALDVPFYLVSQANSKVKTSLNTTQLNKSGTATATLSNGGAITGSADWYAWGVSDALDAGGGSADLRAVGVQSFPNDGVLAFGVNTYGRNSNWAANEVDIYVDVNGDDDPDYVVVSADFGLVTAGATDGRVGSFVFDLRTGDGSVDFLASAPTDGSTEVLPALFDQLCSTGSPCLSASSPRLSYYAVAFGRDGSVDRPQSAGQFNAFTPAISTGMFDTVAPNHSATQTVRVNAAERANSPFLGVMIISADNAASNEAQLIAVP